MEAGLGYERRKRCLIVLFLPSVQRDGSTEIDQDLWVNRALEMFGSTFGGATAYPTRARGIWRDDERGGILVRDNPVVIHCYTSQDDLQDEAKLAALASFCRRMGREANQGEVGIVIDNEYIAIRHFDEGQP